MALDEQIYKFLCVLECAQHGILSQDDELGRSEVSAEPNKCSLDDDIPPFGRFRASLLPAYEYTHFHECADMHKTDDPDDAFTYIFNLPFLILP